MKDKLYNLLSGSSEHVAARLIGSEIIREIDGKVLVGKIVETEAYHQTDEASHSFRGETPRTSVMFGRPGVAYVYFTYGMHYCVNIVTGVEGEGSAVLIRALEPIKGIEQMKLNRNSNVAQLTNGPAKLCQAFLIDKKLNGHDLNEPPLMLKIGPPIDSKDIHKTTRIGISRAKNKEYRFYLKGNPFVSKK